MPVFLTSLPMVCMYVYHGEGDVYAYQAKTITEETKLQKMVQHE